MYILGHAGVTAFVASLLYLPALGAVIGALLPDVIDKGLFVFGNLIAPGTFSCARFLAHTFLFIPIPGMIAYAITRNKKFTIAVMLGVAFHLIEDVNGNVPVLYPFIDYPWLHTCGFAVQPGLYEISMEVVGALLLLLTFGYRTKLLVFREKFWNAVNRIKNAMTWKK
ncbi:MAG: metal-dependent hydrolase [Candidatus Aenigmarchaeota archaeon]|nr:metal-dependent hydrolase [Candidatus Aenigmarchaeota archaeon]